MEAYNPFNGKSASNGSGSQGDGAGGVPGAVGAPGGPGGHPGAHPGGHPVGHPGGHSGGHPGGHPNGPIGDGAQGFPTGESARQTLWMGELSPWMDEGFVRSVFTQSLNENVQVKIIRDRHSGNAGYCFVEFNNQEAAQKALQLNGQPIPNTDRLFRLNWASGGGLVDRRDDRSPEYSIFVGDLGHEVNEFVLVALFQARFPSCKSAKIMTDQQTGQSRGYGFVRFSDEQDQQRALVEMQGVYCGNRPMRVSPATPKNRSGGHQAAPPQQFQAYGGHQMVQPQPMQQHGPMGGPMGPVMGGAMGAIVPGGAMGGMGPGSGWMPQPAAYGYQQQGGAAFNPLAMNQFTDPNNTTVFVGGLSGYVTEDELRSFFQGFGDITYVKIPPGKGCGFVQFVHRHAAEMAINQMQGYPIGNSRVRLSWGRSQNNSGVGTPYRPAPPPPHYYPSPGGPAGPPAFGPGSGFGANHQAAHSGGMGALSSQV